jgi:hypothetical protein
MYALTGYEYGNTLRGTPNLHLTKVYDCKSYYVFYTVS